MWIARVAPPALLALTLFGCRGKNSSPPPIIDKGAGVAFQTRGEIATGLSSVRAFVYDHFDSPPPLANSDVGKDFIVISTIDKNMTMLPGTADGSPPTQVEQVLAKFTDSPGEIAAGDFDGDGDKDIAVLFIGAGRIEVYYNDGAADFTKKASQSIPVGLNSCGLTAAKLDTKSISDDLLCCGNKGTEILVFQRSGDTLSTTPLRLVPPAAAGHELGFITVADLDGNPAYNEVIGTDWYASRDKWIVWQAQNGDFTKAVASEFGSGGVGPLSTAAVDLDGDSINDVIVANWTNSSLTVFRGRTDLAFGSPSTTVSFSDPPFHLRPFHLATGDYDSDGNTDVVVSFWPGYSIALLRGKGDGTFDAPRLFATSGQPSQSLITNFKLGPADTTMDIVTSGTEESRLTYLVGGAADNGGEMYATNGDALRFAVSADFNSDGFDDVVASAPDNDIVSVFRGGKSGRLSVEQVISQPLNGARPGFLTASDLDANGKVDVIISVATGVRFLINKSVANGAIVFDLSDTIALGVGPFETGAADFDGDGTLDIAVTSRSTNAVHVLRGAGSFNYLPMATPVAVAGGPVAIATGDFDKDGFVDFAVSLFDQAHVELFTGDGKGGFTKRISVPVSFKPHRLRTADFDKNGYPDLVVSSLGETISDNILNVLLAKPSQTTGVEFDKLELSGGPGSTALFAGDLDNDGNDDILSASFHGPDMFLWLGNGNGTFQARRRFAGTFKVHTGTMADLNGDGLLDIVAASASEFIRGLSVYLRIDGQK